MTQGDQLAAWRASGEHLVDPVRFHFIEALARRAGACEGEVRRVLDGKLDHWLRDYAELLQLHLRNTVDRAQRAEVPRGPLADLIDYIARQASLGQGSDAATPSAAPALTATTELKSLRQFKDTWAKLSADQRLKQSLAKLPENAGPLNSKQLVHRALVQMQDLSPEYLYWFMDYVDALSWLDRAHAAPRGD